jgi:4'-phosphopantetheinyl transferase EntD
VRRGPARPCRSPAEAEAALSAQLGVPITLACATAPVRSEALSPGERRQLDVLAGTPRADTWRCGRAALKRLLRRLGEDDDTEALRFPHPSLSLTHSDGSALAVHGSGARGIGIDIERHRLGRRRAAQWLCASRLFATAEEQAWLSELPAAVLGVHLLRLWTVKEALFKADLRNTGQDLADYSLAHPEYETGQATHTRDPERTFRYSTLRWDGAPLSVAVRVEGDYAQRG